jgi:hypothetical protein
MSKKLIVKKIIISEIIGFAFVILLLWVDEIFDIPHLLFKGKATPVNWVECIWETAVVLALSLPIILLSRGFLKRIKYLEGFLAVCSFCKKIRINNEWIPIEEYMKKHSEVVFSHSFCPECIKKHYGNFVDKKE